MSQNERTIIRLLEQILATNQQILTQIQGAVWATLTFINLKGDPLMPATIHIDGNGAKAVFTEFDQPGGTGNQVPPIGPVVFSSDNPAVATVDQNGNVAAVAAGTANISAIDQGNDLTASDAITVTADVAVSATMVLTANS
jgi:Big-like domain-containing protein